MAISQQTARIQLVRVSPIIMSAYDSKGRTGSSDRTSLQPLVKRTSGYMTPDAAAALLELHEVVTAAGGDFRVTDCLRSVAEQAIERGKYEAWLAAGAPKSFDRAIMRRVFVARPGRSFHNAGRAIDIDIAALKFPGLSSDKILDKLWDLAIPRGWRPAIKEPDETAKEAWHFDFMGEWASVFARLNYEQAAMAACLDIGEVGSFPQARERAIQAHLHRTGYDVGDIDGLIGKRSLAGLTALGITTTQRSQQFTEVRAKPSSPVYIRKM